MGGPTRLLIAGALVTLGVAGLAAAAAVALVAVTSGLGWLGILVEALALKSMLSVRGLARSALAIGDDLERDDLAAARAALGRDLVSRPTAALDAGQVASAAVESVAENLTDAFLAPVLFFLAFGLPGAVAYRVVNTADAMIGYREGVLLQFGRLAARLDDLLNLAPARLAALALALAAPLAGAGVALTKPGAYRLGAGRAPTSADVARSVQVMAIAAALALPVIVAISLAVR